MNVELMVEMRKYIDRAEDGSLEPDKIDELLDCALECARLLFLKSISAGWLTLRPELENEKGTPFVYVYVDGGIDDDDQPRHTWIAIPPMYAEITAKQSYALSPIIPSSSAIASQVAQHTPRAVMIANANEMRPLSILVIHAYAPPTSFDLERDEFLNRCVQVADGADISLLGDYAKIVTCLTNHAPRNIETYPVGGTNAPKA